MVTGFIMLAVFAHGNALDPKLNLTYAIFSALSSFSMQNGMRSVLRSACSVGGRPSRRLHLDAQPPVCSGASRRSS